MSTELAVPQPPNLYESLHAEVAQNEWLQERLADLELAVDEIGWERLNWDGGREFTRDFLDRAVALSRLNAIKNPLIKRGVGLKANYVWGQGVDIAARDDDVNELVVQPLLDDRGNRTALFGAQARMGKDRALTTDGAVCFVLFPNRITGKVNVRSIDPCEIRDIVTNPDDGSEPWFYLRRWTERDFALDGPGRGFRTRTREAWYPAWSYVPQGAQRPESIDRITVKWESPVYYVKVGGLDGMRFGVPETYAALDWAKAYTLFLEDWATIVRSLSRFAWKAKAKRNPGAMAARLGTTVTASTPRETNASPTTGAAFVGVGDVDLAPMPKAGATVDAESGVPLAKMVGAALGFPYTILMGDPDMGNLATAKTLDRPTELTIMERQSIWDEVISDIGSYAVDWAVRAPGGPLTGTITIVDGREVVVLDDAPTGGGKDGKQPVPGSERRTIDVVFPPVLDDDLKATIEAITLAAATELPPAKVILGLLLRALGVDDADELLADFDEEAWEQRQANAGAAALDRFRRGEDPANALAGGDDGDG